MSTPRARRRMTIAALVVMAASTATITPAHAAVACAVPRGLGRLIRSRAPDPGA
ncbi:hypothetical protein [Nonomuraea africana]|uniref:Uncharacterized protein n=1 Tax=Nonomuraea africana TaxID=46171 RepID=A0ABR9KT80_9ACTN|nr:hypothetical protein [Nonomuraea africana]MBE1565237.1 hypothetical protein [Nonomuraea africana]